MDELLSAPDYANLIINRLYRNDPKFSDTQVWANSADPDQTASRGSGSSLFAIPFTSF